MPLLSLIIPHRNHSASLPRLLDSVLAQSLKELEVIIVDDCSDEGERRLCSDIAAAYTAKGLPVRLIENESRQYTKNCRLIGVEASQGAVIGFADADDELWGTEALERHTRLLLAEKADIVHFAAMQTRCDDAKQGAQERSGLFAARLAGDDIFAAYIATERSTVLWDKLCSRSLWKKILPLAWKGENIRYFEDFFLTSLLFFHAESYLGSTMPGYHYYYENRKQEKTIGRLATLFHIKREVVPFFAAQPGKNALVAAYAKRVQQSLCAQWGRLASSYGMQLHAALTPYVLGEVSLQSPTLFTVDHTRRLLGLIFPGASETPTQTFLINGNVCPPLFHRFFSLLPEFFDTTFCHIVWLAYGDGPAILEARIGKKPVPILHNGAPVLRLDAAALPQQKAERSFAQHCLAFLAKFPFMRKRFSGCWLLVDRDFKADDNAEHFYRWLMREHPERNIYFALDKKSPDWVRLKQEGFWLINLSSLWYFFAWVHAAWLISSNVTGYITRGKWRRKYADIARSQVCFLQHGIIKDYLPELNTRNLDMFVTSTPREYHSIAEDPHYAYKFSPREVQLTGLPRHDELLRKARAATSLKTVLIMPTWRKNLTSGLIPGTGRYAYAPNFSQSAFFRNWQAVLQSETLLAAAKERGYTLAFFPHPYIRQQSGDFNLTGIKLFDDAGGSLQDILADTALLITDYSSIAMDAALIGRSVLYFQFDRDTFFTHDHAYRQGYFDYERDGFGDVVLTVDDLCAKAIEIMHRGCRVDENYTARADAFFTFRDQNNCQRVYDALCRLSGPAIP